MNIKNVVLTATVAMSLFACKKPIDGTEIKGNIVGATEVYLAQITPSELNYIDTLQTEDGSFEFLWEGDSPEFLMIEANEGAIRLSLFVEKGESINLTADVNSEIREYEATGSPGSERLVAIQKPITNLMQTLDSLNQVNSAVLDSSNYEQIRISLDDRFTAAQTHARDELLNMLREDPGSLTNLFIFPQGVGNAQLIPIEEFTSDYELCLTAMSEKYPDNQHVAEFGKRMESARLQLQAQVKLNAALEGTKIGNAAPEFSMPNAEGTMIALSSMKGKVVLVDFWAAWCKPCRAENPNIVKMYNRLKSKGFDIYSVSLDGLPQQLDAKAAWLDAVNVDGLIWPNHVSDLGGWESNAVATFGFQSIPYTLLLDREGKILAKGLRGPELESAIEAAL